MIGNTYGGNPAQMSFAVPDLRGRMPLGAGQATGGALMPLGTTGNVQVGEGGAQLPYLAINYIICYNGIFPARDN